MSRGKVWGRTLTGGLVLWTLWALLGCSDGSLTLQGQYADTRPGVGQSGGPDTPAGTPGGRVTEGGLSIGVQTPIAGELFAQKGVMVKGTTQGLTALDINGQTIEVSGAFEHTVVFPQEGNHAITLQAQGLPPLVIPIQVDLTPPTLELTSPQRGTFLEQGAQDELLVQGRATDAVSGIQLLTVNGQPVQVAQDGSFQHRLRPDQGVNLVLVEVKDLANHADSTRRGVVYGQYEPWDRLVQDALSVRLGAAGFPILEQAMTSVLGGDLISGFTQDGGGDFSIDSLTYQSVDIDLTPQNGYMDMRVALNDLSIDFRTRQTILFIPVTVTGTISIDPAILTGKLYIRPDGQGSVAIEFSDTNVQLQNFDVDIDGILGIFDGLIKGFVEDLAKDLLKEAIDGLALDNLGSLGQSFDLFGQQATLDLWVDQISIDPGGLTFVSDASLSIPNATDVLSSPGSLSTPGAPPGDANLTKMVRFSLADDFLNQLLGNIWRTGGLNLDVGALLAGSDSLPVALNAGTFSLLVGQDLLDYADRETPIGLRMRPLLPPIARIQNPEAGILKVTIADMMLDFSLDQPGATPVPWATVAAHLVLNVNLGFDASGELALSITTEVYVEVTDEPLFDFEDALLETTIAGLLQSIPNSLTEGDGLAGLLGDPAEPSPILIQNAEVRADGTNKDYMSFYLDLLPAY
jgi:hypothetical protein